MNFLPFLTPTVCTLNVDAAINMEFEHYVIKIETRGEKSNKGFKNHQHSYSDSTCFLQQSPLLPYAERNTNLSSNWHRNALKYEIQDQSNVAYAVTENACLFPNRVPCFLVLKAKNKQIISRIQRAWNWKLNRE